MKVEIWSDVVCPWCHIGKRRFEQALARFEHRDDVEVHWRSFELDPGAESATAADEVAPTAYAQRLATKYGTSVDAAEQMISTMTDSAAAEGLDFRFDKAVRANTFDAHQVLHLAGERGVQDAAKERFLLAYFTEGEAVADRDVLVRLATEVGLDAAEVRTALDEQTYAAAVRADESQAMAYGIQGVPFFVIDSAYGVSGAQPADALLQVLDQAWAASHPLTMVGTQATGDADSGQACGPDGCAI